LPFGTNRVKNGGGLAGHNGLASIAEQCGGTGFPRIRIGIGRPDRPSDVSDYVLGQFNTEEKQKLEDVLSNAAGAVELIVTDGIHEAMNRFNRKSQNN
jgi:PTH1 family peptidyl-tRNA hydrolase